MTAFLMHAETLLVSSLILSAKLTTSFISKKEKYHEDKPWKQVGLCSTSIKISA